MKSNQEAFYRALEEAARLIKTEPICFAHHTEQGPIRLEAAASAAGGWTASIETERGGQARDFQTLQLANEHLMRSFAEMMPQHDCSEHCAPLRQ